MIYSMTGYGKVSANYQQKTIQIELKALNSKSMDIYCRLANPYKELELDFRTIVTDQLNRGKVELSVSIENGSEENKKTLNIPLIKSYYQDLQEINTIVGKDATDIHSLLLRMPDVFIQNSTELSHEEKLFLNDQLKNACYKLIEFRKQEGAVLEKDLTQNIIAIGDLLKQIEPFENERVKNLKERIYKHLDEKTSNAIDENRLEQEMIFYIEKLDVSEEKVRLANHLTYFIDTFKEDCPGKKLGFIAQEIGREINTLGSKANHMEIQKIVVQMKDHLEKIKEQLLNTL